MRKNDTAWFQEHFPSKFARQRADKAIDRIDPSEPMTTFLDTWLAAYKQAGGKTDVVS